jgi:hypothetical protein
MPNLVNSRLHGALDYALAGVFLLAPAVLRLDYPAGPLAYITGSIYLALALFTRYPLGVIGMIPFALHGLIEGVLAVVWIVSPWLFGFADDGAARNLYVGGGVGLLVLVALTDYRSTRGRLWRDEERRRALVDRRPRAHSRGPHAAERRTGPRDRRAYAVAM